MPHAPPDFIRLVQFWLHTTVAAHTTAYTRLLPFHLGRYVPRLLVLGYHTRSPHHLPLGRFSTTRTERTFSFSVPFFTARFTLCTAFSTGCTVSTFSTFWLPPHLLPLVLSLLVCRFHTVAVHTRRDIRHFTVVYVDSPHVVLALFLYIHVSHIYTTAHSSWFRSHLFTFLRLFATFVHLLPLVQFTLRVYRFTFYTPAPPLRHTPVPSRSRGRFCFTLFTPHLVCPVPVVVFYHTFAVARYPYVTTHSSPFPHSR